MNEFKVGLLTLGTIAAVVIMSFQITSNQSGFGKYVTYRTIINDATGIFEKSSIKVAGITAGRISKIELYKEKALITFEILKEVRITKGSKLRVKSLGFLGDKYIDIILNRNSDEIIPEGSLIASSETGGLENLTKDASEVLADVKEIVKNIKYSLAPEKEGDEPPIKQILSNVKKVSESLKNVIQGNEEKLNEIIDNINQVSQDLQYEVSALNNDSLMAKVKKIGPVLEDAKRITEDLKAITGKVRKGQGTIGKLINDDEVVDQVSETLAGVRKLVNRIDDIRSELQVFSAYNSEQDNISDFNLDIYTSPERLLRFGVATSEFGREDEREVTTTVGGTTVTENIRETDIDTYRFNFQLGRKVNDWTFRAGIIESSGGLGIDYDWNYVNTRLYLEIFDYRDDIGPNVRFGSQIHMWNVFYLKIAGEDLVSKTNTQSLSLGAGLRFTDEDIKGLLALFLR